MWAFLNTCSEFCMEWNLKSAIISNFIDWSIVVLNKADAVYCIELEFGYNYIEAVFHNYIEAMIP